MPSDLSEDFTHHPETKLQGSPHMSPEWSCVLVIGPGPGTLFYCLLPGIGMVTLLATLQLDKVYDLLQVSQCERK